MEISIYTDFRFVTCNKPTGVGKHIVQMVRGLSELSGNSVSAIGANDQAQNLGPLGFLPVKKMALPWKFADGLWTTLGYPYADRWCAGADWIYCPKNDFIPVQKSRVAVTIHGAHELDPNIPQLRYFGARIYRARRRTAYHRMLRQAALVLTVSEFLKRQIIEWFGVSPEKCCVIGNGVETEYFQVATLAPGLSGEETDRPFVLAVGGLNYLDGGDRIIRVASELSRQQPDIRILIAGCQHEEELRRSAAELPNITLLGYVASDRLAHYMRDAIAFLYPTRYETFGIAAAEAMAAGTPVITCRSTAVPEVVGDAAIYVDPDQPKAIIEALLNLDTQPGLRADLRARGLRRAQAFTWPACVGRLQEALEKS